MTLADQAILDPYFKSLGEPLSDYTFPQLYTWSNSLRILWTILHGHLCVFANGTGDLTLLLPPVGDGQSDRALAACYEIMQAYNDKHGVPERTRIEYASDELLGRFDRSRLRVTPMGTDYIYDVNRMIDLAGGDLASKRQARNRFMRNYDYRVEVYDRAKHFEGCKALLATWKTHQDAQHAEEPSASSIKRQKESIAALLTLEHAAELGLKGMVVYCRGEPCVRPASDDPTAPGDHEDRPYEQRAKTSFAPTIRGFTFGEYLGAKSSSIAIEKTDLGCKGLAQFIFSEFCRTTWSDRPLVNVGDDWGLQSLAWTKMSYRPVKLLQKSILRWAPRVQIAANFEPTPALARKPEEPIATVRPARKDDVEAAVELEQTCFSVYSLTKRQLQYLQSRPSAVFLVAEKQGQVVGQGICLVRRHKRRSTRPSPPTGRIYSLAVKDECRGQKIGLKLLLQMIKDLSDRGVRRIYLEVEETNAQAIKLYEQQGFTRVGLLPNYYGPGKGGLHMLLDTAAEPMLPGMG